MLKYRLIWPAALAALVTALGLFFNFTHVTTEPGGAPVSPPEPSYPDSTPPPVPGGQQEVPGGQAGDAGRRPAQPPQAPPEQGGTQAAPPPALQTARPGAGEPEVTVADIERRYRPRFQALKLEYDDKLKQLADAAVSEYRQYKESGQKPPVLELVKKYLAAGNALENECDRRFYALLDSMRRDLQEAGLPLELVEEAKKEYRTQKAQRKKQLIKAGLEFAGL